MSRLEDLRAHIRAEAENRPGVYRMLGPGGEVLYVGKSVRLRTRLLSYFRDTRTTKAGKIVSHTRRIEWDECPNEFAALLRELRLIKRLRPAYNTRHKRDRSWCFIKLTRAEVPKLYVAGKVANDDARYWGPFRGRSRVREAVRELRDVLELRDCALKTPMRLADQSDLFDRDDSPLCMRAELGRCLAPCAGGCTRRDYMARVRLARRFLDGEHDRPLGVLRKRMRTAAERMQFEYAASLRDRTQRLEGLRDELVELQEALRTLTFVYRVSSHEGADRLYLIRRAEVCDELPAPHTPAERTETAERVREVFAERGRSESASMRIPRRRVPEVLLVLRWFRNNPEEKTRGVAPRRYLERRRSA